MNQDIINVESPREFPIKSIFKKPGLMSKKPTQKLSDLDLMLGLKKNRKNMERLETENLGDNSLVTIFNDDS